MTQWRPLPAAMVAQLTCHPWTDDVPPPEAVVFAVIFDKLDRGHRMSRREVQRFARCGHTRAQRYLDEVISFAEEWNSDSTRGRKRTTSGPPADQAIDSSSASQESNGPAADHPRTDRARDLYSTCTPTDHGTPSGLPAPESDVIQFPGSEPPSAPEPPKPSKDREAETWAEAMEVYEASGHGRRVGITSKRRQALRRCIAILGEDTEGATSAERLDEGARRMVHVMRWLVEGPSDWWRSKRTGAKLIASWLHFEKIDAKWLDACGWQWSDETPNQLEDEIREVSARHLHSQDACLEWMAAAPGRERQTFWRIYHELRERNEARGEAAWTH